MSHSAIKIRTIPVGMINAAPYNPRLDLKPGDREYQNLIRSVDEFGCVEPLVWNKRTRNLVGGHQRLKVLKARGDTHISVSVVDLPLSREKALNIALNKVQGDWDQSKLADLLQELLNTPDLDLSVTGFDIPDARELIAGVLAQGAGHEEQFDLHSALATAGPPVTKPGDLIILGSPSGAQHRLLCGDCTDPAHVRRLMNGQRAALMATDPPYLVGYTGTNHPGGTKSKGGFKKPIPASKNKDWSSTYAIDWDDADANPELYERFLQTAVADAIDPRAAIYIWHASRRQAMLEAAMHKCGMLVHCQVIWVKNRPVLTRGWYSWQHEPCLMGWIQGKKPVRVDKSVLSTVWEIDTIPTGPERPDHPTPKPLQVFQIPLLQHTKPGEVCYEPFAGSGTQIIAAQRLGRRCMAMELSPVYCDVIVRRFIAYAGPLAVDARLLKRYRKVAA